MKIGIFLVISALGQLRGIDGGGKPECPRGKNCEIFERIRDRIHQIRNSVKDHKNQAVAMVRCMWLSKGMQTRFCARTRRRQRRRFSATLFY
mgnify:CR=1 FL=1